MCIRDRYGSDQCGYMIERRDNEWMVLVDNYHYNTVNDTPGITVRDYAKPTDRILSVLGYNHTTGE